MKHIKHGPYAEIVDGKLQLSETGKRKVEEFMAKFDNEPVRLLCVAYPKIFAMACRVSSVEEVSMACMEGCVRAFLYFDESKSKDVTFCAFVMRQTVQRYILKLKWDADQKNRRYFSLDTKPVSMNQDRDDGSQIELDVAAPDDGVLAKSEKSEYLMSLLKKGLKRLTERQRYCVLKYYGCGVHRDEIGKELGITGSAVGALIRSGIMNLKIVAGEMSYSL